MTVNLVGATYSISPYQNKLDSRCPDGTPLPTPNEAPVWTGAPATLSYGSPGVYYYDWSQHASDPNGDSLSYDCSTTDTGITINPATGQMKIDSNGTRAEATVTVTDGSATTRHDCVITVLAACDAGLSFESRSLGLMPAATPYPALSAEYGGTFRESSTKYSRPTIVSTPVYGGTRAMKQSLPAQTYVSSDLEQWRSGIEFLGLPSTTGMKFDGGADINNRRWEGMEVWGGVAVMLAEDWPHPDDPGYPSGGVGYPMVGTDLHTKDAGQEWSGEALAIGAGTNQLDWPDTALARRSWRVMSEQGAGKYLVDDFKDDRGKWVTWIYNIVYSSKGQGRWKVWKNEVVVKDLINVTTLKAGNRYTPYLKSQTYNGWRKDHSCPAQTAYVDEIRWAVGSNKYSAVKPR